MQLPWILLFVTQCTARLMWKHLTNVTIFGHIEEECSKDCFEKTEIKLFTEILQRIRNLYENLDHLLGYNRQMRGLINGIGALSKVLFGTLTEDDLSLLNDNIDQLFSALEIKQ